jgi:colanic acid/amylovoran biosynthesis glycosyltransferase
VVSNPYVSRRGGPAGGPAPLAAGDRARLLFVGRILAEKGVFVAIEAVRSLRAAGRDVSLTLVGNGPALETARALVAELGLDGRVELPGRVEPGRLEEIYSSAHVFVFPTSWPEGFPTVISEAMAAALPIVTTANRGIVDHLRDGENAVFVPEHDPAAVSSAVSMLLDSPELRAAMSAANLRKVGEFAPGCVVGQYLSVLRAVAR